MIWVPLVTVTSIAGAVGGNVLYRQRERKRKAAEAQALAETELALASLLESLRQMERARSGLLKEIHPLDRLARGAALGESRGLISVQWSQGKLVVGLTRAGRQVEPAAAPAEAKSK